MRWCWIVACAVIGCGFGLRSALLLGKDPPHKLPIAYFPSSSLAALGLQCWVLSLAKLTTDFSCLHSLRPLASSLRHGLSHLDKCDHSRLSSSLTSGSLQHRRRLYSSCDGRQPVTECGVDLYAKRNLLSSVLQFFFSAWAALIALSRVLFCLSTSPLALGHNGVVCLWTTPICLRKSVISLDNRLGSLSVLKVLGTP